MSTGPLAAVGLVAVTALMTGTWAVSVLRNDASLVDRVWGLAFVVLAGVYAALGQGAPARRALTVVLVAVWGLRLAAYVSWRNWGEGEDPRYAAMRERSTGSFALRSLVTVFWLQAALAWVVAAPLLAAGADPSPAGLTPVDWAGVVLWAAGFFFEVVGDWELTRFLADPDNTGRVLDSGLWRYTRHPNYFGDATLWWGLGLVGVATGAWWALLGPAVMSALIVKVSGVALTDDRMASGSTREGYEDYVERTNAFFPGPPG